MNYKSDAVDSQLEAANIESSRLVPVDISRILVLYSGGTIGMKNSPVHGYIPVSGYLAAKLEQNARFHEPGNETFTNLIRKSGSTTECIDIPALMTPYSLYNKRIRYSILEYEPLLDSSNMSFSDWIRIATDIESNYELFDAFLVLHGTDTMAYTASALSFLLENLGKTVILTGSQVPISEVRTDAVDNLLGALTIAGHFIIPEVAVFFDNKLTRGNRTTKVNAVEFNAFESPNLRPLVNVGINIDVQWDSIWKPKGISRFRSHKILNPNVASLRLFPGITKETVKAFFSPPISGVVLETYGSGNAPSNRPDILAIIQEACDRGVVVINISQCKKATVTNLYQTGIALFNIGVVPGADMTPECALTKLIYLLGKYTDPTKVRRLMGTNLRGEVTIRNPKQRFAYLPHLSHHANSQNLLVSSILSLLGVALTPLMPGDKSVNFIEKDLDLDERDDYAIGTSEELVGNLESRLIPLALSHTAYTGDIATLRYLVQEFESMVDLADDNGQTALHSAVRGGSLECVKILLKHGASVHLRDSTGRSVLVDSILLKHSTIMTMLRRAGAHISLDEEKDVARLLCVAVNDGDLERVKLFIEAGANPNHYFQDLRTPLHLAAANGAFEIVHFLLTSTVGVTPTQGKEALLEQIEISRQESSSSSESFPRMEQVIIDREPRDRWNRTPYDDAITFGHVLVSNLLITNLHSVVLTTTNCHTC